MWVSPKPARFCGSARPVGVLELALARNCARHKQVELKKLSAVERKVDDLPIVDDCSDGRTVGGNQRRVRRNLDGFCDIPDFHSHVGP